MLVNATMGLNVLLSGDQITLQLLISENDYMIMYEGYLILMFYTLNDSCRNYSLH